MASIVLFPRFMNCYLLFHGQCCNTTYSGCLEDDDEKGMNYRGKIAVSFSGMVCQNWDSQTPIRHKFKPERYLIGGKDSGGNVTSGRT